MLFFWLMMIEALSFVFYMYKEISNPVTNSLTDSNVLSIGFGIIGLTFAITGVKIIKLVKESFPYFYKMNRRKLIVSTCCLSIPMFVRTVWDHLYTITSISKWIQDYDFVADPIFFLVCDIIPIALQFSSMVFGYIKQKDNIKKKEET